MLCVPERLQRTTSGHTQTCPERSYQFSPFYIEHGKEESSDSDIDDKPDQSSNRRNDAIQLQPLVINSPADLIKLVPRRPFPERDNLTEDSFESSASEDEASSEARNFAEDNEEDHPLEELSETNTMSAELLKGLQEQMVAVQAQLATQQAQQKKTASAFERSPIPEAASAHLSELVTNISRDFLTACINIGVEFQSCMISSFGRINVDRL